MEKFLSAIQLLQNHLSIEGYYEGCPCRSCDALRPVAQAKNFLMQAHTEILSRENPSKESQAQARSRQVGGGQGTLAVAVPVGLNSARFTLYVNGEAVMVGWAHDILQYVAAKGLTLSVIP